jgi:hypothetical protein
MVEQRHLQICLEVVCLLECSMLAMALQHVVVAVDTL